MIVALVCTIAAIVLDARNCRRFVAARMFTITACTYLVVQFVSIARSTVSWPDSFSPGPIHEHGTYFVVAHFQYVIPAIAGFGFFALCYLFLPKLLRKPLIESLAQTHFWIALVAFNTMVLGVANLVETVASLVLFASSLLLLANLVIALPRSRNDVSGA